MKKVVNVIYVPMGTADGCNFGFTRVRFPDTEGDFQELINKVPDTSNFYDFLKRELSNTPYVGSCPVIGYESETPENWGNSSDVWSQEDSMSVESFEDAMDVYFN